MTEESSLKQPAGMVFMTVSAILTTPIALPMWAFALNKIWLWYAPLIAPNLPTFTERQIVAALVIAVAIQLFVTPLKPSKDIPTRAEFIGRLIARNIMAPLGLISFSWLLLQFVR